MISREIVYFKIMKFIYNKIVYTKFS